VTSWTPNPWKASLHCAALRKAGAISLHHCSQLQTCLHVNWQNEQVSITHHARLPYPPTRNINQHIPWADWSPPLQNWEKKPANCTQTWTVEGMGGTLNLPWRKGEGQRTKVLAPNCQ
jgi:hypothetical protein